MKVERSNSTKGRVGDLVGVFVKVVLFVVVCVAFFSVLALIVHLLIGDDTSPRDVLVDGLRLFGVALTVAMVVFFVGRWLYWFADRWIRKG